jgi:predicted ATPase/DNA-binding CsgD family transcriptional regulator
LTLERGDFRRGGGIESKLPLHSPTAGSLMQTGSPDPLPRDSGPGTNADGERPPLQLPPQPTRFIDREVELAHLCNLLTAEERRLLTLVGSGGVGKTRLAVAVAERVLERFPGGVWFVDLTALVDPSLVVPTLARAVGVHESPGWGPLESLASVLADHVSLVLLDNFEHLLAAASALETLLAACPSVTMLVTSREPLHLRREQVFVVSPLPVTDVHSEPWTVDDLLTVPAIAFFVDRAQAADAPFTLSAANAEAIAELTRRLDGLPLALELAAARTRLLDPQALLARMEQSLTLLRWEAADLPPRHRSLHATLDWSYALLSPAEQVVFRRLGVFAGGFTLEAIDAVAVTEELGVEALEIAQRLMDQHLVHGLARADGEPRFALLATVREYALERLEESGEEKATRGRHLAHFLALAEQLTEQAEQAMYGSEEQPWLNRLDPEVDNLRAALDGAIAAGQVDAERRFVAALVYFWLLRGYLREGLARIETAVARSPEADPAVLARLLEGAGWIAHLSGDNDRAIAHLEDGLAAARAAGDAIRTAHALGLLGTVMYVRGDAARARTLVAQMLAEARAADAGVMIGWAFAYRVLFAIGPHGTPRERVQLREELDEPVMLLRDGGHRRGLAVLLAGRARILAEVDARAALAPLRESLDVARELDDPLRISSVPWLAAVLLAERLPPEQVARIGGALASLAEWRELIGGRTAIDRFGAPQDHAHWKRTVARARETLGEEAFLAAAAAGRGLSFTALVDELRALLEDEGVLETWTESGSPSRQPDSLISPREREVLALVVEGRSNQEIADALFISVHTVKTHVAALLTKLDADNRAHLATIASQRALLTD